MPAPPGRRCPRRCAALCLRAVPDRSHGRCARRRRPRGRARRLVDLRRGRGGRRRIDPRAVPVRRRPPALQRRYLAARTPRWWSSDEELSGGRLAGRDDGPARRRPARGDGGRARRTGPAEAARRWPTSCWPWPSDDRCPRRRGRDRDRLADATPRAPRPRWPPSAGSRSSRGPLAPFTTLRVGGPADRLAVRRRSASTSSSRCCAWRATPACRSSCWARAATSSWPTPGCAGSSSATAPTRYGSRGPACGPRRGASMTALVKRCAREGLAGFDWAISIPGTFGGAIWANAGAHGGEMSDVVRVVRGLRPADGQRRTLTRRVRLPVSRLALQARPGGGARRHDRARARRPAAISQLIDAHQAQRRATQPLADQNAGSVFRNPPGDHAGRLIDVAGLKGHRIGRRGSARSTRTSS
jgi:UDP-N-acetylmuramate dehydrogenase